MRPEEAKALLNNPAFKELQELAVEKIVQAWLNEADPVKREECWRQQACVPLYHRVLQELANKLARD